MQKSYLNFDGTGNGRLPCSGDELADLELYSSSGVSLGTADKIVNSKWNNQEIPHEPGTHEVIVGNGVTVEFQGVKSTVNVSASVIVAREFLLGPVPVSLRGLQDAQKGGILVRTLRIDAIDHHLIELGQIPGWKKIDDPSHLSVKITFRLSYSNMYGDPGEVEPE